METESMNGKDLQRFIDAQGVAAVILPMDEHTPTVPDAARALGVETDQIIKSLVFVINDEPLLVINSGLARVDRRKLAARLEVGRKRVKFATPERALAITGYVVGSMPPFGHREKLRTFVDPAATRMEVIFGGGGDIDAMMRLTPSELIRVTEAEVLDISAADAGRNAK
ncbi:MAG: YbaK/EbsC family protein [Desulfobacterales bacterium]|nr:YbaK/EbsC family protein [Desulfobacterales bacterium]